MLWSVGPQQFLLSAKRKGRARSSYQSHYCSINFSKITYNTDKGKGMCSEDSEKEGQKLTVIADEGREKVKTHTGRRGQTRMTQE